MNLIYADSYASARAFARQQDLMPGDWKWISDKSVFRQYQRADIYKAPRWHAHPHRADIDKALEDMARAHRLGSLNDLSGGFGNLGMSGG
jgi:hypothetical protein